MIAVFFVPLYSSGQGTGRVLPVRRVATMQERMMLLQSDKSKNSENAHSESQVATTASLPPSLLKRVSTISGDGTTLWGNLIEENHYPNTYIMGVYSFPASNGFTITPLATNSNLIGKGGATFFDNIFHYVNYMSYYGMTSAYYGEYSTESWTETVPYAYSSDANNILAAATTYDPVSSNVYAISLNRDKFMKIDYASLSANTICNFRDTNFVSLAANAQGQLYAISSNGGLHKLDKATGADTYIGYTGVKPGYASGGMGAAFDMKKNTLYWAAYTVNGYSSLFQVDTNTGAASLIGDFPSGTRIGAIYVPAPAAEDGAPAAVSNLAINFTGASKTGSISFTMPDKTFAGDNLTGSLTYYIIVNGDTLYHDVAQAGAAVSRDIQLTQSGQTRFVVNTVNAVGKSPNANVSQWIGYDEPYNVGYINCSMDTAGKVSLSWSEVTTVKHNGYIDHICYRVVRMPQDSVIADSLTTPSYTDQLPANAPMGIYWYKVYAVNGDMTSEEVNTQYQKVAFGGALPTPWYCNFESSDSLMLFTKINSNDDYSSWYWTSDYDYNTGLNNGRAAISTNSAADDWLLTPPLKLLGGREYCVSYSYESGTWDKDNIMQVLFGKGTDATGFKAISDTLKFSGVGMPWNHSKNTVRIESDGEYRFAFHAMSPDQAQYIKIDSLGVYPGAVFLSPDSVTQLQMKPRLGEYNTQLTFKAPTKLGDGSLLPSIEKIEILAQDTILLKTLSNVTPGEQLAYTDTSAYSGLRKYTVVAYNEAGRGSENSVSGYVGDDVPATTEGVTYQDNLNGTATISWNKVSTTGANGRPVNPAHVTYGIMPMGYGNHQGGAAPTITGIKDTCYVIDDIPTTGEQRLADFLVYTTNLAGTGNPGFDFNTLITGAPYALPLHEGFNQGQSVYKWEYYRYDNVSNFSADDDESGAVAMTGMGADNMKGTLTSYKINLAGAANPKLVFSLYGQKPTNSNPSYINVIERMDGRANPPYILQKIDLSAAFSPEGEWKRIAIPLVKHDNGYVRLQFYTMLGDKTVPVAIDNIDVYDVPSHDLQIKLKGSASVKVNNSGTYHVRVTNRGENTESNFTIRLVDSKDSLLASCNGGTLASMADSTYTLLFHATTNTVGQYMLQAVVTDANDTIVRNNRDTMMVAVSPSDYPGITDLRASTNGSRYVTLSWSEPQGAYPNITEDFEAYEPFSDNMSPWQLIDADGAQKTYGFADVTFSHMGQAMSYIIFKPAALGVDPQANPNAAAPSGEQYAISFDAVPQYAKNGHSDDWLISPRLSGREQTIKLKAGLLTSNYGAETFDVLYSTTDSAQSSFQLLETERPSAAGWTEYEVTLPEDARFFALRHTTPNGLSLAFDDISFEGASQPVTGYRIYRDGELIASLPAAVTSFDDYASEDGLHTYMATAMYGDKESAASNVITIATEIGYLSAITDNLMDVDVTVYNTAGVRMASGKGVLAKMPRGIYLVSPNGTSKCYRMIVR